MQRVTVSLPANHYDILIGSGVLTSVGETCRSLGLGRRAVVIADTNTARLFWPEVHAGLESAGVLASLVSVPAGEGSKSVEQLASVWAALAASRLDRTGFVLALGGGVVGDLAGFAAATYLRGVDLVQVPTTLLAQVDSGVGGKTGIDLAAGKNLVGAFHQPRLVLVDTETLASLPVQEHRSGLAEVLKYGVIRSPGLFEAMEANPTAFLRHDTRECISAIAQSCSIKAEIVAADEREGGIRAYLNYGHTVGHGIEACAGYGVYLHGEAVAIGMTAAGYLGVRAGGWPESEAARVERTLLALGLPVRLRQPLEPRAVLECMYQDKKVRDGSLRFVLPSAIGAVSVEPIGATEALEAIRYVQPVGTA